MTKSDKDKELMLHNETIADIICFIPQEKAQTNVSTFTILLHVDYRKRWHLHNLINSPDLCCMQQRILKAFLLNRRGLQWPTTEALHKGPKNFALPMSPW